MTTISRLFPALRSLPSLPVSLSARTRPTPAAVRLCLVAARVLAVVTAVTVAGTAGPARAQNASTVWVGVEGGARDIALADDGTAWIIGTEKVGANYRIYRRDPGARAWQAMPGAAVRIAVSGQTPWVVNAAGQIWELQGAAWRLVPGPQAVDIGASARGVWITALPRRGSDFAIYQRSDTGWTGVSGSAARVDVDADGNPWVVNSIGQIHAYVKGKWQRFASKEPAADISVDGFPGPWIVGTSGAIWHYHETDRKWENHGGKALAVAKRGDQLWHIDPEQAIRHATLGKDGRPPSIAPNLNVAQPGIEVTPQTADQLTVTPIQPLTLGKPVIVGKLDPDKLDADNSLDLENMDHEITLDNIKFGSTPTGTENTQLPEGVQFEVMGCGSTPGAPCASASTNVATTAASRGETVYPEPGLGGFLARGGLGVLESILRRPDAIAQALASVSDPPVPWHFEQVCATPDDNPIVKNLMLAALLDAISKPPAQRTADENAFVNAFAGYLKRRRLFAAERVEYAYNQWKKKQMLAGPRSSLQGIFNLNSDLPRDVTDMIGELATISAGAAAAGTAAAAILLEAPVFASIMPHAVRAFSNGVIPMTRAAGLLGRAAASSGPAAIGIFAIVGATVATIKVAKAADFEKALAEGLKVARGPVDLQKMARTDEGLATIVYYWSKATSGPQSVAYLDIDTSAARKEACKRPDADPDQVPAAARGGRLVLASRTPTKYSAIETLAINGLDYTPNPRKATIGETVWKSVAIARLNCFKPASIANYMKTGKASCGTVGEEGASSFSWSPYKRGAMPARALVAGRRSDGKELVVCRADMGDGIHPGKLWRGKCHVAWGGKEIAKAKFDVLEADGNAVKWVSRVAGQPVPANAVIAGRRVSEVDWIVEPRLHRVKSDTNTVACLPENISGNKCRKEIPMAVCRAAMSDGVHPGKVWNGTCHVAWGGKEITRKTYDVLVSTGG